MVICVCGNINEDIILGLDAFPSFHEKVRASALYRGQGGSAANTAWWLASLGDRARMLGCVGNDEAGHRAVEELHDAGVDTNHVARSPSTTGLAVVFSDGHDKRMVKYDGANRHISPSKEDFLGCMHLHLTSVEASVAERAISFARDVGATVSWDPSELVHPGLLTDVDILFLNEDDFRRSGGASAGVPITVVTKNGGGCSINGTISVGTINVPVVDTTGAGDAFSAGFVHAYLGGATLEACGRYAVACSYYAIRTFGAREGFSSREKIEALIASSY
jgi:ribokinase